MPTRRLLISCACAIATALVLLGCTPSGPQFVESDHRYTATTASRLLESSDPGKISARAASDAPRLRQQALSSLRSKGSSAEKAAKTITRAFPAGSSGVPYLVEQAMFDGKRAWLILEVRGRKNGNLTDRLLWVVDTQGNVLFSSMR